jgi:outer membrane protein TolC
MRIRIWFVISILSPSLLAGISFAQIAPTPQTGSGTQAVQLPLSGRAGQNGSVNAAQTPIPGTTTSVNSLNTTIQVQGPYAGSASSIDRLPFSGTLSLREAVQRALDYNLGIVDVSEAVRQSHGQQRVARSSLLPNLNASVRENVQKISLQAAGVRVPFVPAVSGPFNYFDLRATLTQTVADLTALNNYRSAQETVRANQQWAQDARDLVVLAVGGAYLQTIAAEARVESARAQLETARTLYDQTLQRRNVGLVAQIDVNRSLVQQQTQQQRVVTLENDLAKLKINLARLTGLEPNERYELNDKVPFSEPPALTLTDALKQAFDTRPDLRASEGEVRAAERARSAARAERLPSLAFSADYGAIGINPAQSRGTFTVVGTLRVPIWQGGRTEGVIEQSEAVLDQRRAELEDLRGRIESDVRDAFLDLQAAANQVEVARNNQQVARDTLDLARQRYDAGITDTLEVVQSQEGVATADLDYITSLFAHNLAKLSLARALGRAEDSLPRFLKIQ